MSGRRTILLALLGVGLLAGAGWALHRARARPSVRVTLRITVAPSDQKDFVSAQLNSAKFKYLIGKTAGVRPALAQKLTVRPAPNSEALEAQVAVQTPAEGQRYADSFIETLQMLCGTQARIALASQTIR
jgi:hypothetical protein